MSTLLKMPIFTIAYETTNYYSNPVREGVYELMVIPENNHGQQRLSHHISNSLDIIPQFSENLFGAQLIRFRIRKKFCSFDVSVNATVKKDEVNPFEIEQSSTEEQDSALADDSFKIAYFRYLIPSAFTTAITEKIPTEVMRLNGEELFLYIQRINAWIFTHLKYQPGITNTLTKLDEVLRIRAGVCQDFTHLFIAIMRINGIPARYVSGYLNQGQSFNGDAALHAWVEVFLPGTGWIGLDPSNNLLVNTFYLKIGHGLDYSDCMPIKSVLSVNGNGFTEYSVKVTEQQTQ